MHSLCFWFLSFKIMFLRLIHVVVCFSSNQFLCIVGYYSIVCICRNLFIHSNVDEHLCCFQVGVVMNKLLLQLIYKSLCGHMLSFLLSKELMGNGQAIRMVEIFKKQANCFSKAQLFYILTGSIRIVGSHSKTPRYGLYF